MSCWRCWVILVLLLPLVACARSIPNISDVPGFGPTEEEQVAAILADVHNGMETQRIFKVLSHVSRDYQDAAGRDYEAIAGYLDDLFKNYESIRIARSRPRIVVEGDRARALETFGTVASPYPDSTAPALNLEARVVVHLTKARGRWKIIEWGQEV